MVELIAGNQYDVFVIEEIVRCNKHGRNALCP